MLTPTVSTPITEPISTIFVAIELSQKTWLVTMHSPDRDKISRHKVQGGVVECQGDATTISGERYANTYCFVIRIEEGQLRELTEHIDTALVERVLKPPPPRR
jgi:ketosteroid isomerase-like protein